VKDGREEQHGAADQSRGSAPEFEVFRAPNGMDIYHHSRAETKFVYKEIFEDRVYFRHGIALARGESVLDIGANIGLFTIFAKENFEGIKAYAFEPSPVIFPLLEANLVKYGNSALACNCGLAKKRGEATFTFYPGYSIMSGFHTERDQDTKTLRAGIRSHLIDEGMTAAEIQDRFVNNMAEKALAQEQRHVCELRTVSDILDQEDIGSVGLIKIDAEGSELDILAGIRSEHWQRIRQIVMEIHDPKETVCPRIRTVLEAQGFGCIFEHEKRLSGSGILNCYARRC
jgi:FkbM family methyltransferase